MATKTVTKKSTKSASTKTATKKVAHVSKRKRKVTTGFDGVYHYAVGRRKAAIAQVRIYPKTEASEKDFIVNAKEMKDYFQTSNHQTIATEALTVAGQEGKVAISVLVKGGGPSGQTQAVRLGIARALIKMDDGLRAILKSEGFLTRDARVVERKKPGLRKARRRPQWAKR